MLSEATPTTRLAYIKFMKPTIRKEQDDDGPPATAIAPSSLTASKKQGVKKSILRAAAVDLKNPPIFFLVVLE